MKSERSTASFWRVFHVGSERTLFEFHEAIVDALQFDGGHLWFFGTDRDYWESPVKYQSPREFEDLASGGSMRWDEDAYDAATMPVGSLGLDRLDRLCYLFDYEKEWRFYATVETVDAEAADARGPEVVHARGSPSRVLPTDYHTDR